jgi:hypothetical protein
MRMVIEVVRYLRQSGFVVPQAGRAPRELQQATPIFVRNDSGEQVPAFACLQSTGTVESGGQNYIKIDKPADTTGTSGAYLFNGVAPIEPGGFGVAHDGPVVRMLSSTSTSGAKLVPVVGSWTVAAGDGPFTAIGADDIGSGVIRASVAGIGGGGAIFYGFTLSSSGFLTTTTATATIYALTGSGFGSIIESGATIYDSAGWALGVPSGTNGLCIKQGGLYYAIQAACPPVE